MMGKVGKRTPVWENKKTGRVVCGATIQDALGVGWLCPVGDDRKHVSTLPSERRVVIAGGAVLPENDVSRAIARDAKTTGLLKILAYGREYSCYVQYLDSVRVVIS